jgi:DNA adenine methylase
MSSKVTSPFCGEGSGRNVFTTLRKEISNTKLYVEPYVGSGGMLFKILNMSERNVIINDLDSELIEMYRILKNTKETTYKDNIDTIAKQEKFLRTKSNKDLDKLQKYFIRTCNTFSSQGTGRLYKETNQAKKLKYLDRYQEHLKDVRILNEDALTVIKKFDSPDTFFFLHPPYSLPTSPINNDHYEKLAKVLSGVRGKFMLLVDNTEFNSNLFKKFKKRVITIGRVQNKQGAQASTTRTELLFKNY